MELERKKLVVGLIGYGVAGKGLYEVISETSGLDAEIKYICVKDRLKLRELPINLITFDVDKVLNDNEVNVIVELIDDADAAYTIVKKALLLGKSVVSANKKMIAMHLEELIALQKSNHCALLYEASCCAGIPIIRSLEEYYDTDLLQGIMGIMNGSTNYMLTQGFNKGLAYTEVLKQAQTYGYAESDPFLDVSGLDAKFKLVILMAHAFGLHINPDDVINIGIQNIGQIEWQYAKEKGFKIKLVCHALRLDDHRITAYVLPCFVSQDNKLYHVDDVFNGITTQMKWSDEQFFVGRGAGAYPTASAVLSDLSALTYGYKYEYKKKYVQSITAFSNQTVVKIWLMKKSSNKKDYNDFFINIEEEYKTIDHCYIIGQINLESLKELATESTISIICFQTTKV